MNEKELFEQIGTIRDLDSEAMAKARTREDILAKPPGSLGKLENIAAQLSGISGKLHNYADKTCVVVMCADNGVVAEGVSSAPQSVTRAQAINFTRRLTGVGTLAQCFGADLMVVDVGMNGDLPQELMTVNPLEVINTESRATRKIIDRKLRYGTHNLAKGPAMAREEVVKAMGIGLEMVREIKSAGYDLYGIGEMGIGNTTTSAAVLSALTGVSVEESAGKGGGITDQSFARKKEIIAEALKKYDFAGQRDLDVLDVLAKVGGFDLAAMTGAFLGAGVYRVPVVIDGFISAVAALAATRLSPLSIKYMMASHVSKEQGYGPALEALGLSAMMHLDLRLGEGSGCPLAFQVVRGACAMMNDMATFAEAEINDAYLEEIRKLNF